MTELSPAAVVNKMMEKDFFSQWLGIKVEEVQKGFCRCSIQIREEMLNGFHIAHGGIAYALGDSVLAFAANSHGRMAVSVETSISHFLPCRRGDTLTAHSECIHLGRRMGYYLVHLIKQENQKVALFKGTVYRKKEIWKQDK
jgi:acyl-CoA thioesterase